MSATQTMLAHAGDESTVRSQVASAMADAEPLPVWEKRTGPIKPVVQKLKEYVGITNRFRMNADSYDGGQTWHTDLFASLTQTRGPRTPEVRLYQLREALAVIDEARPVLAALIEAAEAAQ